MNLISKEISRTELINRTNPSIPVIQSTKSTASSPVLTYRSREYTGMCLQYSHYNFILCFLSLQVFNRYFTNSRRSSKDVFLPYIPFYLLYLLNTSFHHHPYKSSLIYQWSIPVLWRTLLQLLLWALNVLRNITVLYIIFCFDVTVT